MTLYYARKCKCGHIKGIHGFPTYDHASQDRYDRISNDPGCRFGHKKRLGLKKDGMLVVVLGYSTDIPCECQRFEVSA